MIKYVFASFLTIHILADFIFKREKWHKGNDYILDGHWTM